MTKTFTVGQRVSATNICHFDYEDTDKVEGIIVATKGEPGMVLINFGAHFDGHDGYGHVTGFSKTLWWVLTENVEALPDAQTQAGAPAHTKVQSDRILNHLLAGNSITQLEAFGVYGIFRLAARIHDLKAKGHKIVTTMKKDANGKPYAEYALVSRNLRAA